MSVFEQVGVQFMPELPEVEVIARGLHSRLSGQTIRSAEVIWPRTIAAPDDVERFKWEIAGRTIQRAWRRGKFIVVDLDRGMSLLIHLRMTGRMTIEPAAALLTPHVRARFCLDSDLDCRFSDVRKFGRIYLTGTPALVIGDLGPEPLGNDFTAASLCEMLGRRRGSIKPLLLNQRFLAGLGNIYVDESLFRAGIHPLRAAGSLSGEECRRLHGAIQSVLREAIERGGTTLSDYRDAEGQEGRQQGFLQIYGRTGEPCSRCYRPVERIRVGQRSTHFCVHCQPHSES